MVFHVRLGLSGLNVSFKPGDSIAIYPQNDPLLVQEYLRVLSATGHEPIIDSRSGETLPLKEFLTRKSNLARLSSQLFKFLHGPDAALPVNDHEPLDLLQAFQGQIFPLQEICSRLQPLLPRFYSVASSLLAEPDHVDLTVALIRYTQTGKLRLGVASHFLTHLAEPGVTPIPFHVQTAHRFALPPDPKMPIIMVGPGTGIAPFRAFMQERILQGSSAKNWLFFGDRNRSTDFLYEDFWQSLVDQGVMRLTTAFSRDQAEKIYVQNRMLEEGYDIYKWLEEGAIFYVCGDAKAMAKDVEKALTQIFITHGSMSEEAAKLHVRALRKEGRYQADVY